MNMHEHMEAVTSPTSSRAERDRKVMYFMQGLRETMGHLEYCAVALISYKAIENYRSYTKYKPIWS